MASKYDKMEMPRKKMASEPEEIKLEIGADEEEMPLEEVESPDIDSMIQELEALGYKVSPPAAKGPAAGDEMDQDAAIAKPVQVIGQS